MFQLKRTRILNFKLSMPENQGEMKGTCVAKAAIGFPSDYAENKRIRCRVTITASAEDVDEPIIYSISVSEFSVNDDLSEKAAEEQAKEKCIPVAFNEAFKKIADATELLCGQRIDLSTSPDD